MLRVEYFRRFGYDPDGGLSLAQHDFGFATAHDCDVLVNLLGKVTTK